MPGRRAPEEARREQIMNAAYAVALRTGIAGVTLRAVAAEAQLSHGLLLFHFKRKDELIGALLDRVLATTAMLHLAEDVATDGVARLPRAPGRLGAQLSHEMERLSREPRNIRLFFEYWALGVRHPSIRRKIGAALERYRAAFRSLAAEMLPAGPPSHSGLTPDALSAVAVSLISGCAVQALIDPEHFDTQAYVAAVEGLIEPLLPTSTGAVAANRGIDGAGSRQRITGRT